MLIMGWSWKLEVGLFCFVLFCAAALCRRAVLMLDKKNLFFNFLIFIFRGKGGSFRKIGKVRACVRRGREIFFFVCVGGGIYIFILMLYMPWGGGMDGEGFY